MGLRTFRRLAQDFQVRSASELFARVAQTPAVQSLRQRLEKGGALSGQRVSEGAQPFFAALLRYLFPEHPIVVVADGVKRQESFHQDIETWLQFPVPSSECGVKQASNAPRSALPTWTLFYPAWEILPHEAKLPHVDVINERLETLVTLSPRHNAERGTRNPQSPVIVTNVIALLQRTFQPDTLCANTRTLRRGEQLDPLDLVEWLEEQGYEPEAKVSSKGEISLRGGILDMFPLTSPWPVRLEFFGNELESIRYFDPLTQISKEEVSSVTMPPGGELGILKRMAEAGTERGVYAASPHAKEHPLGLSSSTRDATLNRLECRAPFAT